MHDQNLAILKGLVSVAWADGKVHAEEMSVIEGLLQAFQATPSESHEVRLFAREPKSIDDVPLTDLSAADRRLLLHHAVLITFVDGAQCDAERRVLDELVARLRIASDEASSIIEGGARHAKSLLHLLERV
ncbi:MAG TPA: TerB family tellurite resistance protein [Polyangiaceae bacterium]